MDCNTFLRGVGAGAVCVLLVALAGCADDWDYFINGPPDGHYTPAYRSSGEGPTYQGSTYTPSQAQQNREYGERLDRQIDNATYNDYGN